MFHEKGIEARQKAALNQFSQAGFPNRELTTEKKFQIAPARLPLQKFGAGSPARNPSVFGSSLDRYKAAIMKTPPLNQRDLEQALVRDQNIRSQITELQVLKNNPELPLSQRNTAATKEIELIEGSLASWMDLAQRAEKDTSERAYEILNISKEQIFEWKGQAEVAQDFLMEMEGE